MAEMVDVVELDRVVVRAVRRVIPIPADAHAGVEQVVNIIVRNPIMAALGNPDADASRVNAPAVENVVIINQIAARLRGLGLGHTLLAHPDDAGAEVEEFIPLNPAILAAVSKPEAVNPDVRDFTVLECTIGRAICDDGRRHFDCRLCAAVALWRKFPIGMMKRQPPQGDILDQPAFLGITGQSHQLQKPRRDDFGFANFLPWHRPVGEYARLTIDIPFAGCVERLESVLDIITLGFLPVADAPPFL